MNKLIKKIFIIIIISSVLSSFTSYTNSSNNLDDQSYVMGIAIDIGDTSKYKISMLLSTLESSATEASTKSAESTNNATSASRE